MFLKVELALIWHGFLNMRLSCARLECSGDRSLSKKWDKITKTLSAAQIAYYALFYDVL